MQARQLGKSDLRVSPICLGCWQFNDGIGNDKQWEPQSFEVSKAIAEKALECGVNFFDTAEGYTNSHGVVRRIFEGRRRDIILADKFGYRDGKTDYKAKDVETSLNLSLQNLKTDYIDLYQIHWPNVVADLDSVLGELKRQQSLGRIREYAVCNYGAKDLQPLIAAGGAPVSNQMAYNLLWRGLEFDVLPVCRDNDISILAYSPLQQGLLCGRFSSVEDVPIGRRRTRHFKDKCAVGTIHGEEGAEKETFQTIARIREIASEVGLPMATVSLSWLLQQDNVAATVVGASRPEQIQQNVAITQLRQEVLDKLSLSSDELKQIFGGKMDMWSPQSRIN